MSRQVSRGLGWVPDLPDRRDYPMVLRAMTDLPSSVDLRPGCPPVYDQGELGSCTANAIAAALEFDRKKQHLPDFLPSRLFIYYNERAMEHTINEDSGAQIRDGMKSVAQLGAPDERLWPYTIGSYTTKPPVGVYRDAKRHLAVMYRRLSSSMAKACLASGFPFVFGFTVYESFMTDAVADSGVLPMPKSDDGDLGGHAVLAVGYDDATAQFLIRNSWGTDWGQGGYFWMPYAYLQDDNLCDDFWTIRLVK